MKKFRYFIPFLVGHIGLVTVHAVVNTTGWINPWEFGGYAMYTTIPQDVTSKVVSYSPEVEFMPEKLNTERLITFRLDSGGCIFGFTQKGYEKISEDMERLGLDELEILFERQEWSEDKSVILIKEMMRVEGRRLSDDEVEINNTVCGENEVVTVKIPQD
jgi:hypothetical protein